MWKKKKVGVFMGGLSAEREISLQSGGTILSSLKKKGYKACSIDVNKDVPEQVIREGIQVAFIALHGRWGEDGSIQGMLEIMGIPYTGSGVLASALAMNKPMAKRILNFHKLQTPDFQVIERDEIQEGGFEGQIQLKFPLVVKPISEGSAIGVSIVEDETILKDAVEEAARYTHSIMLEEFIHGSEITVGVLNGRPLPVIEIIPKSRFYDYRSKYTPGMTEYIIPARLPDDQLLKSQDIGLKAYKAMGCHGPARMDMILDSEGNPHVLEINTIPG
ncbi:MAG: D-alanine--D-alanine ligase, partial [Thermodesulfobacteriota bacterium]|nr:D-alanine--D-alanine ligase [Thermodesulfobacteriota bacterium]